jgi:hypothetical protein
MDIMGAVDMIPFESSVGWGSGNLQAREAQKFYLHRVVTYIVS